MAETKLSSQQVLVTNPTPSSKLPQYVAALVATLGGFTLGNILGWTSPVDKNRLEYEFQISDDQFSWVGACMALGAMVGASGVGNMGDMFGRKKTIIILTIPNLVAWLLLIFAKNNFMLYLGRFFTGFSGGAFSCIVPLYISELSETEIRGTLGAYFQLQITLGILMVYILGSTVSVFWLTALCGLVPIIFFILMMFMPESPIYYLKTFKEDEARRSLQWFRGSEYDVEPELNEKKQALDKMEAERVPISQAFTTPSAKRGLVIGLGIMFFQQFSGVNAVIFYASSIFKQTGSSIDPNLSTIIIGIVMVIVTWVASMVIDKAGRRPLLLLSASVMAICSGALGLFFFIKKVSPDTAQTIGLLPIVSLSLFIIVFSLGLGPIPWMFVSEIFPPQIKGSACSIACLFNWICVFFVTKYYDSLRNEFGDYATFWIFSGISFAGTLFIWNLVVETKGKSMEQIQRELGATPQMVSNTSLESPEKPTKF